MDYLSRTIGDVRLLDLRLLLQEGEGVIDDPRLLDELLELRLVVLQLAGHLGKKSMEENMTDRLLPHFISVAVVENFCLTLIGLTKKVLLML